MADDVSAKLEELHAEIKALRHEQAVTRRIVSTAAMRHHWARHLVTDLETNPRTQYKVHLYGVIYWLINFRQSSTCFSASRIYGPSWASSSP
jgi:hypothetical protein